MNYSKKVIDKYAVGNYCEIKFRNQYGVVWKKVGWLVPNDYVMFKSMRQDKYALLMANDQFYSFNLKDIESVRLESNGYKLPKTMKGIEK